MAIVLLSAPLADAAAPMFKWSGGAAKKSRGWANTENWEGGETPSSSEPVALEFPELMSANCTSAPPTDTCYESENNVSGLSVESLHVEDSQTYVIAGEPITLGKGGLTAAPATNTTKPIGSIMELPMALGAPQTWSIEGQSSDTAIDGNQLLLLEEVSGAGQSLDVKLNDGGGLDLANEDEVGALKLEGVDSSRAGIFNGVIELLGAELNASDQEPVSFSHIFAIGNGDTGPLTTDAAEVVVLPGEKQVERLHVDGATLDPESSLTFAVAGTGSTAGIDYAQLSSTGQVDLNGAELVMEAADSCKALPPGQVYTLVASTGNIVGSFGNAGEGEEIPIEFTKGCNLAQTLHIEYHRSGGTQTITGTVIAGPTSESSLEASAVNLITNQNVTLTVTVEANGETPSGTVAFDSNGVPISVCTGERLNAEGSRYTAICHTSFTASGSPQHVSAVFIPEPGLNLRGSSATETIAVGKAQTTTALQASTPTTPVNQSAIYKATVSTTSEGPVLPGGTVLFANDGTPIGSCAAQPLQPGISPSTATCLLSYPAGGTHSVTASYSGDSNFASSASSAQMLTVQPLPEALSLPYKFPGEGSTPGVLKLDSISIPVHGLAVALVRLTCEGSSSCKGKLTLSTREVSKGKKGKKGSRSVVIGSESFLIAAGMTVSVDVHLNASGRALLRGHKGQLRATLRLAQASRSTQTNVQLIEAVSNRRAKKG